MPQLPPIKRFESRTGVRVYRIPCDVLPGMSGRVHVVLGAGPATLVDTGSGMAGCTAQIFAGLDQLQAQFGERLGPDDLRRIIITHSHTDHIGGLAELVARTKAEVAVHALDSRAVADFEEHVVHGHLATRPFLEQAGVEPERHERLLAMLGLRPGRVVSAPVGMVLADAMDLDGLRVIHTPGHSPGHVCLLADDILICGDHILPVTVPQQWPESSGAYNGLGHYLESLRRIEHIPGICTALGGHEIPMDDVYHRIAQIRDTQARRLERLLGLVADSPAPPSVAELAARMYTHTQGFHEALALMDVGSRVEHLYQNGRLAIANVDQLRDEVTRVVRYRPA